jgi:predicted MFS family arabinose efflux permease
VRVSVSAARAPVIATVVTLGCILPVFLTGSLAIGMQADLGFGDGGLGVAVGAFYGVGALVSWRAGLVVDRLGAERTLRWATAGTGVGLFVIATLVQSSGALYVVLVLIGGVTAWVQPATNVFLARRVPGHRLGFVFGIQKSAIPAGALLGGLAVPAFQSIGWRWAFVAGSAFALVAAALVPAGHGDGPAPRADRATGRPDVARRDLVMLSIGVGLGNAASVALSAFVVRGGVAAGLSENVAAAMLVAGSALAVGARLLFGLGVDSRPAAALRIVAALMAAASVAFALLATQVAPIYVVAVPLAFATAFAWIGVFQYAVVRTNPSAPATATGVTMTGTLVGAVVGPLVFGVIAEQVSFGMAWATGASMVLVAAATVVVGARRIHPADGESTRQPCATA